MIERYLSFAIYTILWRMAILLPCSVQNFKAIRQVLVKGHFTRFYLKVSFARYTILLKPLATVDPMCAVFNRAGWLVHLASQLLEVVAFIAWCAVSNSQKRDGHRWKAITFHPPIVSIIIVDNANFWRLYFLSMTTPNHMQNVMWKFWLSTGLWNL